MKDIERRKFLTSCMGLYGLANFDFKGISHSEVRHSDSDPQAGTIRLKGKENSGITHWDIITIGNLSRNRYWGESDEKALHSVICTCTVISGKNFHLIIDPSIAGQSEMAAELQRRTGLSPDKIDAVFITHAHLDHIAGLKHFPKAVWYSGKEVATALNITNAYKTKIQEAGKSLFGVIEVFPTPGHTPEHQSLRFDCRGLSIVVAGDAVATRDFWDERQAYYNVIDKEKSAESMEKIDSIADIIIPGHDNYFLNI